MCFLFFIFSFFFSLLTSLFFFQEKAPEDGRGLARPLPVYDDQEKFIKGGQEPYHLEIHEIQRLKANKCDHKMNYLGNNGHI